MLLSFTYLMFSAVLSLLVRRRQPEFAKDLELIRAAAPTVSVVPPASASDISADGWGIHRCACSTASAPAPARTDRDAGDAPALAPGPRALIHDRDSKLTAAFDDIFGGEGVRVIHTPIRAPQANAYAERFVRTVRTECLDHLLILGRRNLEQVLRIDVQHYTASDRTADSHSSRLNRRVSSDHPAAMSSAAIALAVSSTSTTEPQPE
jgi:hypothetical protein